MVERSAAVNNPQDVGNCDLRCINHDLLVPPILREATDGRIRVIRLPERLGSLINDNDIGSALDVVALYRPGYRLHHEPGSDRWKTVLANRLAMVNGQVKGNESIAFSLIVSANFYTKGAEVMSFILNPELRREGIGKQFYLQFEDQLRQGGFRFIWGNNSVENHGFFQSIGRDTDAEIIGKCLRNKLIIRRSDFMSIKFFDGELREKILNG